MNCTKLLLTSSRIIYTALILQSILVASPASAEKLYDANLRYFIAGDLDTLTLDMESEHDWNFEKQKLKLGRKNTNLYLASLVAMGELEKLEAFLPLVLKKYSDEPEIQKINKEFSFFKDLGQEQATTLLDKNYLIFSEEEKAHLALIQKFPHYLEAKNTSDFVLTESLRKDLLTLIDKVSNRTLYFPAQLEYLLELEDPNLSERIRDEAEYIILKHRAKLYPHTIDNYELAIAYRALGILGMRAQKPSETESYFKLAYNEILKMRSFWVQEDILVYRRFLKITSRKTKLGYVLPQYIYALRDRFKT